jgi:prolyl oligopeptidase
MTLLPRALLATTVGRPARAPAASRRRSVARIDVVRDTYFGETLSDPYRWMENDKDPEWLPFLKGQNDRHPRGILDPLPDACVAAQAHSAIVGRHGGHQPRAARRRPDFLHAAAQGRRQFQTLRAPGRHGAPDRVLVDPDRLASGAKGHVSLDWWRASPDGRHVVYGCVEERQRGFDAACADRRRRQRLLSRDKYANTEAANPRWLDDGSGFFLQPAHRRKVGTPERFLDSQARFHLLGSRSRTPIPCS